MEQSQAEVWDSGRVVDEAKARELAVDDVAAARGLSAGVWLELLLCLAIDICGIASYFYPNLGEASDVGFAFVYAFFIETLFGWPELALFGFWEEASRTPPAA